MSNPYLDRFFATRRRLKIGLVVASALAGAVVGAALTVLGKTLAGAPPAPVGEYLWNMVWFAGFGVLIGPVIIWTALRNTPLWRTVIEPLAAGIAIAAIGVVAGSPILFLLGAPIGVSAAVLRLTRSRARQRDAHLLPE